MALVAYRASTITHFRTRRRKHGEVTRSVTPLVATLRDTCAKMWRAPAPYLLIGITPTSPIPTITLDPAAQGRFRLICAHANFSPVHITGAPGGYESSEVANGASSGELWYACAYNDGSIGIRIPFGEYPNWGADRPEMVRLDLVEIWKKLRRLLSAASEWPRTMSGYQGDLRCHVGMGNLAGTVAVIPREMESRAMDLVTNPHRANFRTGWDDLVIWERPSDVNDLLEPLIGELAHQLQFLDFSVFKLRIRQAAGQS